MKNLLDEPIITFGVTAYKRPELLKETINSILAQDFKNFKVIIGNDDPSQKISYKTLNINKDDRVEILNYEKNVREVNSMNYMLSQAKSEWFSWLADDDVLHPNFISKFLEIYSANKDENIVAILCDYIEGSNTLKYLENAIISNKSKSFDFETFTHKFLLRKIKVVGVYGFLKTKIVKEIGGVKRFGFGAQLYGDTAFTIELASKGKIILNQSQLFFLRRHEGSFSTNITNADEISSSQKDFLKHIRPVLYRTLSQKKADEFIFALVKWFCIDNLGEAFRNKKKTRVFTLIKFLNLQKQWLVELKLIYIYLFIIYILSQLNLVIINYLKLRIGIKK